jgi:hypothetical protein
VQETIPGLIAVFLALLLGALVVGLLFQRDFRDAILGGPGEASIFGLITVKGVAVVLLSGLFIGGILFLIKSTRRGESTSVGPTEMRLNVHFEPNEVNPLNSQFRAKAFIKKPTGDEPIALVPQVVQGAFAVRLTVPNMTTPFYIVFETPKGTWKTDDYTINEAPATAHKLGSE